MASSDDGYTWKISLPDGLHTIKFEHGTTSGKRVITVDGQEIHRKDWMFKLVGRENFKVGGKHCCISIDAVSGFAYEYTLTVDGKPLEKFKETQSKKLQTWKLVIEGSEHRICLDKDTMDVWVDGEIAECVEHFCEDEDGTEKHFVACNRSCIIKSISSGKKRTGIVHQLYLNEDGCPVPECHE